MSARPPAVVVATGLAFEAAIARRTGAAACCGPGDHIVGALDAAVTRYRPAGIVSFGIAGGLDPALRPGAVIVASEIVSKEGRFAVDVEWSAALMQRSDGKAVVLFGAEGPVADAAEKARLFTATQAVATDMESHRVARFASERGIRFATLRVVADPADRSVPGIAVEAMRADGTADMAAVLKGLAGSPRLLPAMARLAVDTAVARRRLVRVSGRLDAGFALVDLG